MVQQVLQRFDFTYSSPQTTPLSTRHSLSALPSDESVEPSGPYAELVCYLMYLMTCTRPDLAYPLSILARYVAPRRHRPEHMAAAKRVLRYLCSTSGLGLVLGGRRPVVLTGHADASWADDQATQRSSQGYTFSLGSGSVSWRSTRSSSVLGSSCEAEIYAGAMAAQELRWLTYLLTDLGEPPRSPPVLYVDNKAMLALCWEHRMEHRTKHIALRYFLARELQQRGQLRLAYVASEANTADIFTKALAPGFPTCVDIVLGMDWLRLNEVILSFQDNTLSFTKNGTTFQWQVPKRHALDDKPQSLALDVRFASALQFNEHVKGADTLFVVQLDFEPTPSQIIEDLPPQMKALAEEYSEVFKPIPDGLPPDRVVGHTIPVEPGKAPPFRPLYRLSPAEYEEAKQHIEEYFRKGWIEPSASPYGAPILFVHKKGGGLRRCINYRALNKITIKIRYPLPRIEDLFDRLQGAQWFSALDLAQGYHQLRITEDDVPKTAFRSPFGHFQWRVLSFGLTNAPASFLRAMNDVFREAIGQFVLVYLDDILVYSKTGDEHTEHLKWVLGYLREHKYYARLWKCHFYKRELEYLGHNGLKEDPKKVAAVQEWPVPRDVGQVRSFLGLANYFCHFLENYSTIVAPLTALTRKGCAWG
ncbi:unnamed protein product [Closterium sp. NIES-54]